MMTNSINDALFKRQDKVNRNLKRVINVFIMIYLYILANDIGLAAYVWLKIDKFFTLFSVPKTDCGGFSFTGAWTSLLNPILYLVINLMQTLAASWVSVYLFYKSQKH